MSFVQNFPFFSIILSLLCAVISFFLGARWAKRLTLFLLTSSIVLQSCILSFCFRNHISYAYMMGHYSAPWGNEIAAGILEPLFALLFAVVMLCSVLGGMHRMEQDVFPGKQNFYWIMVDLAHVSLMALCYTNDIFTGYVFIEICTIASCALLSIRESGRSLLAAVRYMIFALVGSGLFLIGVIFTYSVTGQLLFPQLYEAIGKLWAAGTYRFSMTVAIGLMVVGLAIKSGMFPFHFWMPDTYGRATPASSGILSGVVSKGYIFLLIKIIYRVIGIDIFTASGVQTLLLLFGIAGMIVGSVSAIFAKRLTTMVAFSSVAQIGYIYMGLGMGTQAALVAVFFQIFSHALTKPMLFLSAFQLSHASGGRQDFHSLHGAGHRHPVAGCTFTVGALSMVGIPIFAGFIPKLYFATSAFGLGWKTWPVLAALAISTILNVMYFLYTTILIWIPEEEGTHAHIRVKPQAGTVFPAVLLAGFNLLVGLQSAGLTTLFTQGMDLFCQ
ncbi:MAG: sodium:proton antiporter [Clostridiales bacterium]|nr:sodium:proton antiporter [Clostridiales bacterium]